MIRATAMSTSVLTAPPSGIAPRQPAAAPREVVTQLEGEVAKLEAQAKRERGGVLNALGKAVVDIFSDSGKHLDEAAGAARKALADGLADGALTRDEANAVAAQVVRGQNEGRRYEQAKERGGNIVGGLVMAFTPLGRGVGLARTALTAAGLNVGAHALFEGGGYSAGDAAKDALVGAATMGVASKLMQSQLVARLGAGTPYGRWITTGAVVSGADNAVYAGLQQGFRDGNWDEGVGPGLARTAGSAAIGGGIGLAVGALGGGVAGYATQRDAREVAARAAAGRGGGDESNNRLHVTRR